MARNPVTELLYGPRELDAAGIGEPDTFQYNMDPRDIIRTGVFLRKCQVLPGVTV